MLTLGTLLGVLFIALGLFLFIVYVGSDNEDLGLTPTKEYEEWAKHILKKDPEKGKKIAQQIDDLSEYDGIAEKLNRLREAMKSE